MSNLNKVSLMGRLGKDPESKSFSNGNGVVNFSVATSETWKDKQSGEKKEKTEWHNVAVFNEGLRKVASQYLRKGARVYVEGKLQTRKYEKNGEDRYVTEVVLNGFGDVLQVIDWPDKGDGGSAGRSDDRKSSGGGYGGSASAGLDDDIPFSPEWR